jgi:signal transduction histidine kinase
VLQELIKNIVKHSKAKNVGVQLMHVKKHLVLIVEDDGVGMNRSSTGEDGIGILSLKGRVNTVKGTINFEPSPNSGTLVTVRIPLAKKASSTR